MPAPTIPPNSRILYRILTEKSDIDFGRWQGLKVGDIMEMDPSYVGYLYYNFSNLSFKKEILERFKITPIAKPGKDEEAWKAYKAQFYFDTISDLTDEQKMHRKVKLKKINRGRALSKAISVKNANHLSKGQLQAINHGHGLPDKH